MGKMGFYNQWIELIMGCIESVEFQVLLNGTPKRVFTPNRGLRQGDPLSPYLFLICAEGLSGLLNQADNNRKLTGLRINKYCPSITHLFYADDGLLFFKASKQIAGLFRTSLIHMRKLLGKQLIMINLTLW